MMSVVNVLSALGFVFFGGMWLWSVRIIDRQEGLLFRAQAIFQHCTVEYGACCCGEAMKHHDGGMQSGHSPVDQGAYCAEHWLEDFRVYTGAAPELQFNEH